MTAMANIRVIVSFDGLSYVCLISAAVSTGQRNTPLDPALRGLVDERGQEATCETSPMFTPNQLPRFYWL